MEYPGLNAYGNLLEDVRNFLVQVNEVKQNVTEYAIANCEGK